MSNPTEVIVLRDLPKQDPAPPITANRDIDELDEDIPSQDAQLPLTAEEIESFSDGSKQSLTQDEAIAFINSASFAQDDIVTSAQYQAKMKELVNYYSISQLRKYIQQPQFRKRLRRVASGTPKAKPNSPSGSPAVIVPNADKLDITTTSWQPLLPPDFIKGPKAMAGQRAASRYLLAESIVRECWGVKVEEELDMSGRLFMKLSAEQYHLWTNSIFDALESVHSSSRFFKNSRLLDLPKTRSIRIEGPRPEAEAMAATIRDAFGKSEYAQIELEPLKGLLQDQSHFHKLLAPKLRRIMDLTKSSVAYVPQKNLVRFASYYKERLYDAMRLVTSLLPVPTRTTVPDVSLEVHSNPCYLSPTANATILPYRFRHERLGRVVEPVSNTGLAINLDIAEVDEQDSSPPSREGIMKTVLDVLSTANLPVPHGEVAIRKRSYWDSSAVYTGWSANIGHILRPAGSCSPVTLDHISTSSKEKGKASKFVPRNHLSDQLFAPDFPSNIALLSLFNSWNPTSASLYDDAAVQYPRQLIAKLIPSPFSDIGTAASRLLPEISLIFEEIGNTATAPERRLVKPLESDEPLEHAEVEENDDHSEDPEPNGSMAAKPRVPSESGLRYIGMEATLEHQVIDVPCPSLSTDLRFDRKLILRAHESRKTPKSLQGPAFRAYISRILASAANQNAGAIRADRSVLISIPRWAVRSLPGATGGEKESQQLNRVYDSLSVEKNKHEEARFEYLFSGFEYRERRDMPMLPKDEVNEKSAYFSPKHLLRVEQVEGGQIFGKGMQAAIVPREDYDQPLVDKYRPLAPLHVKADDGVKEPEPLVPADVDPEIEDNKPDATVSQAEEPSFQGSSSPFEVLDTMYRRQDAPDVSTEHAPMSSMEDAPKPSTEHALESSTEDAPDLSTEEALVKTAFSVADLIGKLQRRELREHRVVEKKAPPPRKEKVRSLYGRHVKRAIRHNANLETPLSSDENS